MSYTKINWTNTPSTLLNAENLNHMDDGIAAANKAASSNGILSSFYNIPNIAKPITNAQNWNLYSGIKLAVSEDHVILSGVANDSAQCGLLNLDKTLNCDADGYSTVLLKIRMRAVDCNVTVNFRDDGWFSNKCIIDSNIEGWESASTYLAKDLPPNEWLTAWVVVGGAQRNITKIGIQVVSSAAEFKIEIASLTAHYSQDVSAAEKTANKISSTRDISDKSTNYPSIEYLENYYTTTNDIAKKNAELKADIDKLEKEIAKSGFSVFNNKSPEWQTIHGASAWSFKPNSIYIAPASMQNNVITDLPSAAYLLGWPKMIITLGGDENSRPVSFTDTYATDRYIPEGSTPTGTFPFGGTIQILITEKRRWYRTKFGDVNGYSSWIMWGIDFHGNATAADFSNNLLSDITHNSIIRLNNASLVTDTPNNDKTSVTIETKSPNYTDTGDEKAIVQQAYYYRSDQSTDSIYVRISKASDGSYSPWEAYILSSNLESHLKQSEYIKALEARIAALEKNN